MKTQAYTFFCTWIITLILTIAVTLPQTAFGQMHSNTVTSNTDIKNLESKLKDNLNSIEIQQMWYNNTKEHNDELINDYGNEVAELLVTHYEAIKNAESYGRKYYADIIKLHRYAIKEFISRYHKQREDNEAHMLDLKEKTDKLKKENTRLQKELTALIENTTNQSYTPEVHGNVISATDDYLDSISADKYLDEIDNKTRPEERNPLSASTENSVVEPDNYYRPKCPDQNPGDPEHPNRKRYKFDTNNNPNDGNYILCGYRKNGEIEFEIPHANNKKHGISYYYISVPYHAIKTVIPYTDGKKDGVMTSFMQAKDGHRYKWSESEFSEGIITKKMMWREDGSLKNVSTYSGGRKNHECFINKDGSERCVKY